MNDFIVALILCSFVWSITALILCIKNAKSQKRNEKILNNIIERQNKIIKNFSEKLKN